MGFSIGKILDPLGLFQPGGLFGGESQEQKQANEANATYLRLMQGQEGSTLATLKKLLSETSGLSDQGLNAEIGAITPAYQKGMNQIETGTLSPETMDWMTNVLNTRLANTKADTDATMGSAIDSLASKGIMSDTTQKGSRAQTAKAMQPSLSAADQDFYNSMVTMPSENAMSNFNLASQYGADVNQAYRTKRADILGPYLSMWNTQLGLGASNPAQPMQSAGASSALGNIISTAINSYNPSQKTPQQQQPQGIIYDPSGNNFA